MNPVINKIRKLLNMTEKRGATAEEAATAAAMVQRLLMEHNLSMAQVEDKPEGVAGVINTGSERSPYTRPLTYLLNVLAKYNLCHIVAVPKDGVTLLFGKPHNIEVVSYLHATLARALMKEADRQHDGVVPIRTWKASFLVGATTAIRERLKDQQDKSRMQNSSANALVVVENQLAQRMAAEAFAGEKLQQTRPKKPGSFEGYANGFIYGQTVPMNQAINERDQHTQLTEAS